jgi:broad specificity phosphatase PhoE
VPTLHFVRHGETDWNREGRIQGSADVPLSAAGREQARELAASLAERPIGAIYASDLRRKEVGTAWLHPDERHPGGESMREVYERVAAFLDHLLDDPPADEIALVTSGGPIRVGTAHLAREPVETIVWRAVDNCSVTTVEVGL